MQVSDTARRAEQARREKENVAFNEWWKASGHADDPIFTLTMEGCAHSAWQACAEAALSAAPQPVAVPDDVNNPYPGFFVSGVDDEGNDILSRSLDTQAAAPTPPEADGDETKHTSIGMAMAAGIVMRVWGDTVPAREILGAAGFKSVEDLRRKGVEEYDIEALAPCFPAPPTGGDQ